MTDHITPEGATNEFLERVILRGYDGAIDTVRSYLKSGPPGRKPRPDLVALHEWFDALDELDQANVLAAVKEAVDSAVFGFLVLLDGAWGGYPVEGIPSEFALFLLTYLDDEARERGRPEQSIRINRAEDDDLHDQYRWLLQDREGASG